MEQDKFTSVCRFCGAVFTGECSEAIGKEPAAKGNDRKHNDYIIASEARISESPFVELRKDGKQYQITSMQFYANDGFLHPIPTPHWRLRFQCNTQSEKLLFGIAGKRPASRMAIQLGEEDVISFHGAQFEDGYSWFPLSEEQLLAICTTQTIDLTTDLPLPANAQFNELPIFASRFYNIAFNRMKFMYSIHVNLITDDKT
ncbi:MAG: hypothetical protein J5677_00145 [Bacteroidales bacterium]|nr:hypothetical protein [Bacteroidales bacterium]